MKMNITFTFLESLISETSAESLSKTQLLGPNYLTKGVDQQKIRRGILASTEWIGIFWWNFAALIQVSIEMFWHPYIWNLKYLPMRQLQFLITSYYSQISWHDMKLKLALEIEFDKWNWWMILSTWTLDCFRKFILVCKLHTVLLAHLLCPVVNFITGAELDISSKKLHHQKMFLGKITWLYSCSYL